jgi:hypothetical protein
LKSPIEREVDGIQLDRLTAGRVCDVSPILGSWLLAEEYAELEMRSSAVPEEVDFSAPRGSSFQEQPPQFADDRRRRH